MQLLVVTVIVAILADRGEGYSVQCDQKIINRIKRMRGPGFNVAKTLNELYGSVEQIVATTANYFDKVLADFPGEKTFGCSDSSADIDSGRYSIFVKFWSIENKKEDNSRIAIFFQPLKVEDDEVTFESCSILSIYGTDNCPKELQLAKAYRFYQSNGVVGVYTCNKEGSTSRNKEGFIKVNKRSAFGGLLTNGKTVHYLESETKRYVDEAKEKASELGLDIQDVSIDCP